MLSSQGDLTIFSQGDLIGKTTGQNFLTVWFCQQWVGGKFLSLIVIIPSHHLHHILRYGSDCCPLVVDPYTWLALIAGIALAAFFLRSRKQ